jgi:hypothetical protein
MSAKIKAGVRHPARAQVRTKLTKYFISLLPDQRFKVMKLPTHSPREREFYHAVTTQVLNSWSETAGHRKVGLLLIEEQAPYPRKRFSPVVAEEIKSKLQDELRTIFGGRAPAGHFVTSDGSWEYWLSFWPDGVPTLKQETLAFLYQLRQARPIVNQEEPPDVPQPRDNESDKRAYESLVADLLAKNRAHRESVRLRFQRGLNSYLAAQKPETFEQKHALVDKVSNDLKALGFVIRHSDLPCHIVARQGEKNRLGQFLINVKGSGEILVTRANLQDLLPLELMDAPTRQEALSAWHERVRRKGGPVSKRAPSGK